VAATARSRSDGRTAARAHGAAGSGLVATWSGFAVFLALMFFAVQVLFNLWTASMVTAAASDAARKVASVDTADPAARLDAEHTAQQLAEADFRRLVGGYSSHVTVFDWRDTDTDADFVHLTVEARNPSFLLRAFVDTSNLLPFQHLKRSFRVRKEHFR
jgi:Flp pilus assembly protein TadG